MLCVITPIPLDDPSDWLTLFTPIISSSQWHVFGNTHMTEFTLEMFSPQPSGFVLVFVCTQCEEFFSFVFAQ